MKVYIFWLAVLQQFFLVKSTSTQVTITYNQFQQEEIQFMSTNKDICPHFNAHYVSHGNGKVTCRCGSEEIFYRVHDEPPRCQSDDGGRLYECQCTSSKCSFPLEKKPFPHQLSKWTFRNANCDASFSTFSVSLWDGSVFAIGTELWKDFDMRSKVVLSTSEVTLRWQKPRPPYTPYAGRLIKFTVQCLKAKVCFVLKGLGTYTMSIDNLVLPTEKPADSVSGEKETKDTATIISVVVVVVFVVLLVVILLLLFYRKYHRKNSPRNNNNAQQPATTVVAGMKENAGYIRDPIPAPRQQGNVKNAYTPQATKNCSPQQLPPPYVQANPAFVMHNPKANRHPGATRNLGAGEHPRVPRAPGEDYQDLQMYDRAYLQ